MTAWNQRIGGRGLVCGRISWYAHHGKKDVFLEIDDDCFAGDELIPAWAYADFVSGSRMSKSAVQEFANEIGVHPGIVVGRDQHEKRIRYDNLNGLKMKLQWAS